MARSQFRKCHRVALPTACVLRHQCLSIYERYWDEIRSDGRQDYMKLLFLVYMFLFIASLCAHVLSKRLGASLQRYISWIRGVGAAAFIGIVLSIGSVWVDLRSSQKSTKNQETILDSQTEISSAVRAVPQDVVAEISKILELDAALIEEGPIKDLARLASSEEPRKISARQKLTSQNTEIVAQGANELLDIATERAQAIAELNTKAGEDYREAGAAFLLAKDYEGATSAYREATKVDATNIHGLVTLSELYFQQKEYLLAEESARAAVSLIDESGDRKLADFFPLNQLIKVLVAAEKHAGVEGLVQQFLETTELENVLGGKTLGLSALDKYNITVPAAVIGNEVTHTEVYWGTNVRIIYRYNSLADGNFEDQISATADHTFEVIAINQRIAALRLSARFYAQFEDTETAKRLLNEAIKLSTFLNSITGGLGRQNETISLFDMTANLQLDVGEEEALDAKLQMRNLEKEILDEIVDTQTMTVAENRPIAEVELISNNFLDRGTNTVPSVDPLVYEIRRNVAQRSLGLAIDYFNAKLFEEAVENVEVSITELKQLPAESIKIEEQAYLKVTLFYAGLFHSVLGDMETSCSRMLESSQMLTDNELNIPEEFRWSEDDTIVAETRLHLLECNAQNEVR